MTRLVAIVRALVAAIFSNRRRYREIPGPRPHPIFGNLSEFARFPPWELAERYRRDYGPVCVAWAFRRPIIFVQDPDAIGEVLGSHMKSYCKDEPIAALRPANAGPSPFTLNGSAWAREREASLLTGDRYMAWQSDFFPFISKYLRDRIAQEWEAPAAGFESRIEHLVFDLQSYLLFGRELDSSAYRAFSRFARVLDWRMKFNVPVITPGFLVARSIWFRAAREALEEVDSAGAVPSLGRLAFHQSRRPHSTISEEMINLYPGGIFSLTSMICHLLHLLSEYPDRREAIAQEIGDASSYATLAGASKLEAFLRETMRRFPAVPAVMRSVKSESVTLGGFRLFRGTRLFLGPGPLHHDPTHWPHPLDFRPERWTADVIRENPHGSRYFFPFGRGPRACLGQEMALFMMRSFCHAIVSKEACELSVSAPARHEYYFGCMMPRGMKGTISAPKRGLGKITPITPNQNSTAPERMKRTAHG